MNAKKMSLILGVAFIMAGVIGFIPNPLVGNGGIFHTNLGHNLVHIITAALFFFFATRKDEHQVLFMKIFGVTYFALGVLGFFLLGGKEMGSLIPGVHINQLDNYLHIGLGLAIFGSGIFIDSKIKGLI